MIDVNNFLNFFAILIISSENLDILVDVVDQYGRARVLCITKTHENLSVFFAPVQTLKCCLLLRLGLEQRLRLNRVVLIVYSYPEDLCGRRNKDCIFTLTDTLILTKTQSRRCWKHTWKFGSRQINSVEVTNYRTLVFLENGSAIEHDKFSLYKADQIQTPLGLLLFHDGEV